MQMRARIFRAATRRVQNSDLQHSIPPIHTDQRDNRDLHLSPSSLPSFPQPVQLAQPTATDPTHSQQPAYLTPQDRPSSMTRPHTPKKTKSGNLTKSKPERTPKLPTPNSTSNKTPGSSKPKSKRKKSPKKKTSAGEVTKSRPQTPSAKASTSRKASAHPDKKSTKKSEQIPTSSTKYKTSKSSTSSMPKSASSPPAQASKRKRSDRQSIDPVKSELEIYKQRQTFFVSDPSRVTSLLCDALLNSRVGVCDAHLHTTDNSIVPVSRSVLTVLNSYLASYTCAVPSKPKEEHPPNFQCLPLSSQHLRHVLEFIYTNDCSFLRKLRSKHLWRKESELPSADTISNVILLAHAAHICHTPDLSAWSEGTARELVRRNPPLVCAALRTVLKNTTANSEQLISSWLARIFEQPAAFLGRMRTGNVPIEHQQNSAAPGGLSVLDLDANSFAKILAPDHHHHEYYFRAIYCWATRGYTDHSRAGPRWRNAKRLAQRIDFTKVSSKFLLGFVDSSGLVDEQTMASIYRMQLASKSNLPKSYGLSGSSNTQLGKRSREFRSSGVQPPPKKRATSRDPSEAPHLQHIPNATPSSIASQFQTTSQFQTVPGQQQSMPQQQYPSTSDAVQPPSFTQHIYPPVAAAENTVSGVQSGQGAAVHPPQSLIPHDPVVYTFPSNSVSYQYPGSGLGAVTNDQTTLKESTTPQHGHQNQPQGVIPAVHVSMPQTSAPIGLNPMFSNAPSHDIGGTQMDHDRPGQPQNTSTQNASSSANVPAHTNKDFGTSLCSAVYSKATGLVEAKKSEPSETSDHFEAYQNEQGVVLSHDQSKSAARCTPFQITTRQAARRIEAENKAVKQEIKEEEVVILT
ncbi:hypothetical protein BWQ96_05109 [Gracilariopsis chorda]|uniref:BTB domain-containing protein n=1 Tax=Gracilariopsis chorda TaxID=448386 RepID=A0A2V3ISN1_9FLOR|nr:hypothetical protein BWQ96_05109 [Gracilariopsis chorda]|eukprot:PXF45135.1 hypothetical protein BWQ96_05109 [Gracilariopsis chorda]